MYCGCSTSGDCNSAIISAKKHFVFCFHIIRIFIGSLNVSEDQFCPCKSIGIAERSCLFGSITLYYMSQRINPCSCYNGFWQFSDHLAVQDHIIRNHTVIYNSFFGLFLRNCHDCITGSFRTGTAGSRYHYCFYSFSCL